MQAVEFFQTIYFSSVANPFATCMGIIMRKIRVLIVEDSVLFRTILAKGMSADPFIEVVGVAGDPFEARDAILKCSPDVMTLDVELPRMNGIEFLRQLMPQYPIPVVVVSAINASVFDALNAGAVDFVKKPAGMNGSQVEEFIKRELITKIKIASTAKVGKLKKAEYSHTDSRKHDYGNKIIAIGASTGGTEAIAEVLGGFNKDIPGVVIVQHMPPGFTAMYAERINNQYEIFAKEARNGDKIMRGCVLVAPGDAHMQVKQMSGGYYVECRPGERVSGHCPSVDVLFQSVAKAAGDKAIGIILTGMGADGAKGLLEMRKAGAETIGQDEESCIVYGMPKVAYEIGAVKYQAGLSNIAGKVYNILNKA